MSEITRLTMIGYTDTKVERNRVFRFIDQTDKIHELTNDDTIRILTDNYYGTVYINNITLGFDGSIIGLDGDIKKYGRTELGNKDKKYVALATNVEEYKIVSSLGEIEVVNRKTLIDLAALGKISNIELVNFLGNKFPITYSGEIETNDKVIENVYILFLQTLKLDTRKIPTNKASKLKKYQSWFATSLSNISRNKKLNGILDVAKYYNAINVFDEVIENVKRRELDIKLNSLKSAIKQCMSLYSDIGLDNTNSYVKQLGALQAYTLQIIFNYKSLEEHNYNEMLTLSDHIAKALMDIEKNLYRIHE